MNAPLDNDRDLAGLDRHVQALRAAAPSTADADAAQARLMERVDRRERTRMPNRAMRWAPAGALALLALVLVVPLMTSAPALAFADVQRHFREFTTLAMTMETRVAGGPTMTTVVKTDRAANVRVDIDATLSVVVNPKEGRILHLMHEPRMARTEPFAGTAQKDDATRWIDELGEFRGQATLLPETRTVEGRTAHGWSLEVQGQHLVLWATDDGLPVAMEVESGDLVAMTFRFAFDAPLEPETFSTEVPAGYTEGGEGGE